MKSLRRRLVVILLVLTVFTWLVTVAVTGLNAQQLLRDQIDQQLIEYMDGTHQSIVTKIRDEKAISDENKVDLDKALKDFIDTHPALSETE